MSIGTEMYACGPIFCTSNEPVLNAIDFCDWSHCSSHQITGLIISKWTYRQQRELNSTGCGKSNYEFSIRGIKPPPRIESLTFYLPCWWLKFEREFRELCFFFWISSCTCFQFCGFGQIWVNLKWEIPFQDWRRPGLCAIIVGIT